MSRPVANVFVAVRPFATMTVAASAITDAGGGYTITGRAPGPYKIAVLDVEEIFGSPIYWVSQWYNNAGAAAAGFPTATVVTRSSGAATNLGNTTLVHNSPATITGTVSSAGGPVANILEAVTRSDTMTIVAYAGTSASGTYTITVLSPGTYKVAALGMAEIFGSPSHWISQWYDSAGISAPGFATATPVTVTPGDTRNLGTAVLAHT